MSRSNDNKMRSLNTWKREVFIVKGKIKNLILVTNKNQNTHVRNKHVGESMISLHAQHVVLKKPKVRGRIERSKDLREIEFFLYPPWPTLL